MYYHFLRADGCLNYPPHTKVEVGQTLTCDGPLGLCINGMHASKKLIDALKYAPGAILCEVELSEELLEGEDKVCARSRTVLSMRDVSSILHEFALRVAEQALKDHNITDERSWNALATKRRWLRGVATDVELFAANVAARDAWKAAEASWFVGRESGSAAVYAVKSATAVAETAASDAARAAAWTGNNDLLMEMLCTTTS